MKIRDGNVQNRPIYVAMGINPDGERDVLGLRVGPSGGEGAKHWLAMLTDLRNRGVIDVCIVCCDGLRGMPDAIAATWPPGDHPDLPRRVRRRRRRAAASVSTSEGCPPRAGAPGRTMQPRFTV